MRRLLEFLVYSNAYLAIGAGTVALATAFLMGQAMDWKLFFIPFSATLLIYNFNRFTDSHEDIINIPERVQFSRRFGRPILILSSFIYMVAIFLAFQRNFLTLAMSLMPVISAFIYSYFRFKKIFLVKNILVAASWGFSVLLVGAYFQIFDLFLFMVYLFFTLQFLVNVIIFDVKDLKGDSLYKIKTLPGEIGLDNTKKSCFGILSFLVLIWIVIMSITTKALVLLPFLVYVALFVKYSDKYQRSPWWYYGIFVDGEFLAILFILLIWWFIWGI